jgi:hypothetical protein
MANILDRINTRDGGIDRSAEWYRNTVRKLGTRVTANKMMQDGILTNRPNIGLLNLFYYDPKYKKTLPYYDIYPLVLPLDVIPGGFAGINFHYLAPLQRFRLLERLESFKNKRRIDNKTLLNVNLSRVKNIPEVKPIIKKYLFNHVRSRFLKVDLTQAAYAIYLPVQRFQKASAQSVYRQTREAME